MLTKWLEMRGSRKDKTRVVCLPVPVEPCGIPLYKQRATSRCQSAPLHDAIYRWAAEVYRLQGELLLRLPRPDIPQATACFHQALDVARRQQAKALELRAALSLSRLWQQQGQRAEAHALLAPIYGWFTEGFDTADLQDAKAVVEELGSAHGEAQHPA